LVYGESVTPVPDEPCRGADNRLIQSMCEEPNRDVGIFTEALRVPKGERGAFLDRACAGDQELRRKVEALLEAHERVGDFLETPPAEIDSDTDSNGESTGK